MNIQLTEQQKEMLALALFSQAMRAGPQIFAATEELVHTLQIEDQFVKYAENYKAYSALRKHAASENPLS